MHSHPWEVQQSLDAVMFDCDSTLSAVEGITVLAQANGVYEQVHALTEKAMTETGVHVEMYQERLLLVKPREQQLAQVVQAYWEHVTPDVVGVIACLQHLGKTVYVVSAGIQQAVVAFAERLYIAEQQVFAVTVNFNQDGTYLDFDYSSPLVAQAGKAVIVQQLRRRHARIAHIGDGMNDIEAAHAVDRFIGYGGVEYRDVIARMSDFYIRSQSMAPLLPLLLTAAEAQALVGDAQQLYMQGLSQLKDGAVEFRSNGASYSGIA